METLLPNSSRTLQYYVMAKRWASDLEFFRMEIGFLQQLLDQRISRPQVQEHIDQLVKAGRDLIGLLEPEMAELLYGQLFQLELMAEDIITEDADEVAAVQVKLENQMSQLSRRFQAVKRDVYRLVLDGQY